MDSFYRPTWLEISLDALRHNLASFRKGIPEAMNIMAVVKANAYGHGAVEIAREALRCGAHYLGVAFLDEAIELRNSGIIAPVLVLGYTPPTALELALKHDITITVYSVELLEALAELKMKERAALRGEKQSFKIHIKIDTGMGRLGVPTENEACSFIEKALQLQDVVVEGLYTHYARADEADKSFTYEQHRRFERIIQYFREKGIIFSSLHAGNSATAIDFPELSYNMLRLGISMYGLYPSAEVNQRRIDLQPVMSFKTAVVMVKMLPPHSGISYGSIYQTQDEEQIATLPVGYGDGFSRLLTGRADVLIRGCKVPVVGRICMDQCMINVTGISDVVPGDEVVIFGSQGDQSIKADDLARTLGTINYEITCMVSHRVPRVYISEGKRIAVMNPLL